METSAREFADELNRLMKQVRSFVGGDWQGLAAGSHHDAWAEWEDGARQVIAGLEHDAAAACSSRRVLRHRSAERRLDRRGRSRGGVGGQQRLSRRSGRNAGPGRSGR
ncbi:WXG100 family type VII secretion target [Nocardia gipuzkoensis]